MYGDEKDERGKGRDKKKYKGENVNKAGEKRRAKYDKSTHPPLGLRPILTEAGAAIRRCNDHVQTLLRADREISYFHAFRSVAKFKPNARGRPGRPEIITAEIIEETQSPTSAMSSV